MNYEIETNPNLSQIGSTWNINSDPCSTMNCVQNTETGEISIQKVIQFCNTTCDIVSTPVIILPTKISIRYNFIIAVIIFRAKNTLNLEPTFVAELAYKKCA